MTWTDEQVKAAAREFQRVWDENVDTFDPELHDADSYIETAMRAALDATDREVGSPDPKETP